MIRWYTMHVLTHLPVTLILAIVFTVAARETWGTPNLWLVVLGLGATLIFSGWRKRLPYAGGFWWALAWARPAWRQRALDEHGPPPWAAT